MRIHSRTSFPLLPRLIFGVASICLVSMLGLFAAEEPSRNKKATTEELSHGREIFLREWLPNDPRSHGGDGLGPVFNDSSCVACHNLGGAGGGGPASKNVDIITAVPADAVQETDLVDETGRDDVAILLTTAMRFVNGVRMLTGSPMIPFNFERKTEQRINIDELAKLHPGFRTARSIVLHRFGTEHEFEKWHPEHSNAAVSFVAFPQAAAIGLPVDADQAVAFRPDFQGLTRLVLRQFGFDTQSEKIQAANFEFPGAVPIISASKNAPSEIVLHGDQSFDVSNVHQAVPHAVQQLITFFAMIFTADFDEEMGLAPEAMNIRSIPRLNARPSLLASPVDESHSWSTEKKAKATLVASQRNPTALFGAGLIDAIPDSVIEEAARTKHRDFPTVKGRVNRLRDGRIGKFGWKGQMSSLRDFTLTACAVEVGLNVPGHDQAVVPYKPEYRSPGLDLNDQECNALISYLASLPAPTRSVAANADYAAYLEAGEKLFAETGCAACHTRKLGDVDSIYSDLLLHDMGPALADSGHYGTILPEGPDENDDAPAEAPLVANAAANGQSAEVAGARSSKMQSRSPRRSEWRTPPLWGVRDSGPYLHDGGAETIPDAIAMHGGEALPSTNKYFKLTHEKRQQLISFLKSLTAP